jgi:hypothetical protein
VEIMAKQKSVKKVKKHVFKDPMIEEIVEVEIEFICPIRGKIKQKTKVKKMKKVKIEHKLFVGAQSLIDDLEKEETTLINTEPEE